MGSGSLLTFPTLLALGYPPLTANVSNTLGLVSGSVSGAAGYRPELVGQGRRLLRLSVAAGLGGLLGAALLLVLPSSVFRHVVPVLVLLAVLLVIVQPRLARAAARRRGERPQARWLPPALFATSVYGGYFGAAVGVLLIGVLGLGLPDDLQRINAAKNALSAVANGVASVLFLVAAPIAWPAVLVLALSSTVGGALGARYGRRLAPGLLRGAIIVVGLAVSAVLFVQNG